MIQTIPTQVFVFLLSFSSKMHLCYLEISYERFLLHVCKFTTILPCFMKRRQINQYPRHTSGKHSNVICSFPQNNNKLVIQILQRMFFTEVGAGSLVLRNPANNKFPFVVNKLRKVVTVVCSGSEPICHNLHHLKRTETSLNIKIRQKCIKHTYLCVAFSCVRCHLRRISSNFKHLFGQRNVFKPGVTCDKL
jgi:hypothetical protein